MGILRELFGPSREEIWRQLCQQIDAEYVKGGFWHGDKVVGRYQHWTITLDTYTVSTGEHSTTYTRLRAPFVNKEGFRFTLYRKSVFSGLGKWFGMQDLQIGDPLFDEGFIIQGNDEAKVRALFSHQPLRELIEAQPAIHLTVKDDQGWFRQEFPEGVDELHFQVVGVIKDVVRLKSLFTLFAVALHFLGHLSPGYEDDPQIAIPPNA